MPLDTIFPLTEVRNRFPKLQVLRLGSQKLSALTARKAAAMHGLGLAIWDLMVAHGSVDEPMAMAKHVRSGNPRLMQEIERHVGFRVLLDIDYALATIRMHKLKMTVAELLVARIHPNDLYLVDVEFSDPRRPIPRAERRFPMTKFAGLGLLGTLFRRADDVARELKCAHIRLTAATADHVDLFERFGYAIADTPVGRRATEIGVSIPMVRAVR